MSSRGRFFEHAIGSGQSSPGARRSLEELFARRSRRRFTYGLGGLIGIFVVALLWPLICVTVPAGHLAVKWYRFLGGTDTEHVYGEGSRLILPWDKVVVYEARVQQLNRDFDVLTRDGLSMTVNVAIRFRINPASVGGLHKFVGPDYIDRLLIPSLGSYARAVFSQNSTDAVYTTRRTALQDEVKKAVVADLWPKPAMREAGQDGAWIFVDDLLIRGMRFPPAVQAAIDRKMEQYQLKQEYAYRLEKERLESERKEVEAQGIAKSQSVLRTGISDSYLRWKDIDARLTATLALAHSPNAKLVLLGDSKGGMPLMLGGDAGPRPSDRRDGTETAETETSSGNDGQALGVTAHEAAPAAPSVRRAGAARQQLPGAPEATVSIGAGQFRVPQKLSVPVQVLPGAQSRASPYVNLPSYAGPDFTFQTNDP
jgi:regulator of protease activity HflC (stomatin/prohibitin superfamily)